jgi:hypothetical protein
MKKTFDKYSYYEQAVQNPEFEVEFILKEFKRIKKKTPYSLREDFCGTAVISTEWVKAHKKNEAFGIDLDIEPIEYNLNHHQTKLGLDEQRRLHLINKNVLNVDFKTDVVIAYNFSYFIFKERKMLLDYFKSVKKHLKTGGLFFLDSFGGPDCYTIVTDKKNHGKFKYYWECKKFNLLTHHCQFAIHFEPKNQKIRKNVFVYNWRLWSVPEICDLLKEAGFKDTITYWEGDDKDGSGDGKFKPNSNPENCLSFVSYIVGVS